MWKRKRQILFLLENPVDVVFAAKKSFIHLDLADSFPSIVAPNLLYNAVYENILMNVEVDKRTAHTTTAVREYHAPRAHNEMEANGRTRMDVKFKGEG